MSEDVTVNVKGLDQLLKALGGKPPVARIGVLGTKANRNAQPNGKSSPTNAEIGAAHEFGSIKRGLPARSFLRVPISDRLEKEIENSDALDKNVMAEVIREGSVKPWLTKITILAERIVLGAFASGGYGKWAPWRSKNYSNNTGSLLVDTQQLRNSITSEVK